MIKVTLFFANFGYKADLRQGPEVIVPRTAIKANQINALYEMLQKELKFVIERMKEYYNRHQLEGPRLKRGDKVYLSARNLRTKRPSEKLDFKKLGPFVIEEKISTSNYRLSLLDTMKVYTNVFYISLLELVPPNTCLAIQQEVEDEEEEQDVEEILDSRIIDNELQYLIKQLDFGLENNSQEPLKNLNYPEKLEEFYRRYLDCLQEPLPPPYRSRRRRRGGRRS